MRLPDHLVAQWSAAFASTTIGWDFSGVADGMDEPEPPWDFDDLSRTALARSGGPQRALDMGTGGGEQLIRLVEGLRTDGVRPPSLEATEGWPPNVPVAMANLAPYGIPVWVYDADTDEPMPFADERFSLVLNRHEAYCPAEVRRVLRPGGHFLTQQVGSLDASETIGWFGKRPPPVWSLDKAAAALHDAGLTVREGEDFVGVYRFGSVTTLLRYFALVPWDLPDDFTVANHLPPLARLHRLAETGTPIELTLHRWYLSAHR